MTASDIAPILPLSSILPQDEEDRIFRHQQIYTQTANAVNLRDIGIYDLIENQNGQNWFLAGDITKKRIGYRLCGYGTIAGVTLNIPHNIADIAECRITRLYGTLQDSPFTVAYPIPLGNAAPIDISVTSTNIVVGDSTAAYAGFIAYVVLEYVRDR